MLHRREFLKASILGSVATAIKMPVVQAQSDSKARTRIVFLGTKGGPRVEMGRSNPANLIEINGTRVILDCGMGVTHQLAAAKVRAVDLGEIHPDQSSSFRSPRIRQSRVQRLGHRPLDAHPFVRPERAGGNDKNL